MNKRKVLSAALIAVTLATPAMARTSYVSSRHLAEDAHSSASPTAHHNDGFVSVPDAAFPPAPPDGENCDVGDDPRVC